MKDVLQDKKNNNYGIEAGIEEDTITTDSVLKGQKTKSRHIICLENAKKMELANKVFVGQRLDKCERDLAYTFICGEKPPLVRRGPKGREDDYFNLAIEFLDMKSAGMRTNSIKNINVILKRIGLSKTDNNINLLKDRMKHLSGSSGVSKATHSSLNVENTDHTVSGGGESELERFKQSNKSKSEIFELRGIKSYLGEDYRLPGLEDVTDKNFYTALNKGIDIVIDKYSRFKNDCKGPNAFTKMNESYLKRAIEFKLKQKRKKGPVSNTLI